ncbi:MAG: site-specific DNA-methyltransferase [Thermoplasmata archaeon]|nr:site-specific DNA-methyltransferase [Thermoplasmata archaeon]
MTSSQATLGGPAATGMLGSQTNLSHDNRVSKADRAAHQWYRFVLSFPPHLVRHYAREFGLDGSSLILDPFCGTGTTLVEAKKLGIASAGIEALPFAAFASSVKVDWTPDPVELLEHSLGVSEEACRRLRRQGIFDSPLEGSSASSRVRRPKLRQLDPTLNSLLLASSISPKPLHKALVLLDVLREYRDDRYYSHECLSFAQSIVRASSNLHFGPEVGLGEIKSDPPVVAPWLSAMRVIVDDLEFLRARASTQARVYKGDSRHVSGFLSAGSVDAVFTSPPYPNEKDYTRTTRLESVLLGFTSDKASLRAIKQELIRSNSRGVFRADTDDVLVAENAEIGKVADQIEARRMELRKTSGFERLYARVTKLYFGGMLRHLQDLRTTLKPGARLAYVVGDQASYLRVMIRTGKILASLAESLGYQLDRIDLFRTRHATATGEQLREEVVVLRWPGEG